MKVELNLKLDLVFDYVKLKEEIEEIFLKAMLK